MAENSPKIEIKDFTKPIINTRIRYLEENDKINKRKKERVQRVPIRAQKEIFIQ